NILVRELPYTTGDLAGFREGIFFNSDLTKKLKTVISQALAGIFKSGYNAYEGVGLPRYLLFAPGLRDEDYRNLDLPVFYRRVDQTDIVDGRGNAIPIPAEVTIDDEQRP